MLGENGSRSRGGEEARRVVAVRGDALDRTAARELLLDDVQRRRVRRSRPRRLARRKAGKGARERRRGHALGQPPASCALDELAERPERGATAATVPAVTVSVRADAAVPPEMRVRGKAATIGVSTLAAALGDQGGDCDALWLLRGLELSAAAAALAGVVVTVMATMAWPVGY